MRMVQAILALASVAMLCVMLAGFFGARVAAFDSLASFRVQLTLAAAALVILCWAGGERVGGWLALMAMLAGILGLVPTLVPARAVAAGPGVLTGWQQNLRFDNAAPEAVVAAIRAADPDIVTLEEVSAPNMAVVEGLADRYPTRVVCEAHRVGRVAVLAKLPAFGDPVCVTGEGLTWVELTTPDGSLTVAAIHLHWPWPYQQPEQVADLAARLEGLSGRVLVAGDFNAAPWTAAVGRIGAAIRGRPARGLRLSFMGRRWWLWPGLPLDHVVATDGVSVTAEMDGSHGSDHRAIRWRLAL